MATETTATKVIINKVKKAQYDVITKADNELYLVTDYPTLLDGKITLFNAAGEAKVFDGTADLDLSAGLLYSKEAKDFVAGGSIEAGLNSKEDKLTSVNAGDGISITRDPTTNVVTIANTNTSAEWGLIEGDLSDQEDLQAALDSKQDNLVESDSIKINEDKVITAVEATVSDTTTTGVKGIVNLYGELGQNEDGTLTQKAASNLITDLDTALGNEIERSTDVDSEHSAAIDSLQAWQDGALNTLVVDNPNDPIYIITDYLGETILEGADYFDEQGNITLNNKLIYQIDYGTYGHHNNDVTITLKDCVLDYHKYTGTGAQNHNSPLYVADGHDSDEFGVNLVIENCVFKNLSGMAHGVCVQGSAFKDSTGTQTTNLKTVNIRGCTFNVYSGEASANRGCFKCWNTTFDQIGKQCGDEADGNYTLYDYIGNAERKAVLENLCYTNNFYGLEESKVFKFAIFNTFGNSLIYMMKGATTAKDGLGGLVPPPTIADKEKFLKGDGTWSAVNVEIYDEHINNSTIHITQAERLRWNDTYTQDEIDSKLSSTFKYKGSVDTYNDLPTEGMKNGDVYNIKTASPEHGIKAGDNVVWVDPVAPEIEGHWDILAGITDLTEYRKAADQDVIDATKQDVLTAGDGIDLTDDVVSLNISNYATADDIKLSGKGVAVVCGESTTELENDTILLESGKILLSSNDVETTTQDSSDASNKVATTQFVKTAVDNHAADSVAHITASERARWNDTYTQDEVNSLTTIDDQSLVRNSETNAIKVNHDNTILDSSDITTFTKESAFIVSNVMQIADTAIDPTPLNNKFYVELDGETVEDPAYYTEDGYHGINAWTGENPIPELRTGIKVFALVGANGSLFEEPYGLTYNEFKNTRRVYVGEIGDSTFTYTNPVTSETETFNVSGLHLSTKARAWGAPRFEQIGNNEGDSYYLSLYGNGSIVQLGIKAITPSGIGVNTQALEFAHYQDDETGYIYKSGIVRPTGGNISVRNGLLFVDNQSLMPSVVIDEYKDNWGWDDTQGKLETAYGTKVKLEQGVYTLSNKTLNVKETTRAKDLLIIDENLVAGDSITVGNTTVVAGTDFEIGTTISETMNNIINVGYLFSAEGVYVTLGWYSPKATLMPVVYAYADGEAGNNIACSTNNTRATFETEATSGGSTSRANNINGLDLTNFHNNNVAKYLDESLDNAQVPTLNKVNSMIQESSVQITLRTWDDE